MLRVLSRRQVFEDPAFPIRVMLMEQADLEIHSHDFMEQVVVLDGVGDHLFDRLVYPICAGEVFVVGGSHVHGYRNTSDLRISNLLFDESFVLDHAPWLADVAGYGALFREQPGRHLPTVPAGRFRLRPDTMARVDGQIRRLYGEMRLQPDDYRAMAAALLVELLVELCREYRTVDRPIPGDTADVGRAISYLENHFDQEIDLVTLEKVEGMSARTLSRRFNQVTGLTPIQYLLRVRIGRACSLLATTDLSITDVAFRVGFDDSNYFSRQFHSIVGSTPSAYRRAERET